MSSRKISFVKVSIDLPRAESPKICKCLFPRLTHGGNAAFAPGIFSISYLRSSFTAKLGADSIATTAFSASEEGEQYMHAV
ncbi:hypothetical protein PMIN03_002157 [Paraphaeosphaeria minitans]